MSQFILPLVVCILAEQILPSPPRLSDSITASFQFTQAVLSCTKTTSPTLTHCVSILVVLWYFLSAVRYSFLQRLLKWLIIRACALALRIMSEISPKSG